MSRVTHAEFLPLTIDYWDYYIVCQLNIEAARVLQRMEYWDRTKGDSTSGTEETHQHSHTLSVVPKEDTSRFIWKTEEELYWELMGSCGERALASALKFLVNERAYLACRNNPYRAFDRTKQYQLCYELIQEHITKLGALVKVFVDQGRRVQPVQYAIEALTREGTTIDQLTVSMIAAKLAAFHTQLHQDEENVRREVGKKPIKASLPGFIRVHLKKDESEGFTTGFPYPQSAEWKPAICGMETCNLRNGNLQSAALESRTLGGAIPKITLQRLLTKITNKEAAIREEIANTRSLDETPPAASGLASLEISDEERSVLTKLMEKLGRQQAIETEQRHQPTSPPVTVSSKQADTQQIHQERVPTAFVQREEGSRKDEEERASASSEVPIHPAEDAPLVSETLVQINEFKRGARFEETMRVAQLQAANTILGLSEPLGIEDFERAFDEFNNAKGRALYGEILVSHLAEFEPKHGRHRILRVLDRVRHREQSRARTPTQHEAALSAQTHQVTQPNLSDAQRAQLAAIKAKLGTSHPPQSIGA